MVVVFFFSLPRFWFLDERMKGGNEIKMGSASKKFFFDRLDSIRIWTHRWTMLMLIARRARLSSRTTKVLYKHYQMFTLTNVVMLTN